MFDSNQPEGSSAGEEISVWFSRFGGTGTPAPGWKKTTNSSVLKDEYICFKPHNGLKLLAPSKRSLVKSFQTRNVIIAVHHF